MKNRFSTIAAYLLIALFFGIPGIIGIVIYHRCRKCCDARQTSIAVPPRIHAPRPVTNELPPFHWN